MRRDADRAPARYDQTATEGRTASDETAAGQEHETGQRYTVHEAALLLGLSIDAVRKRAERGRLRREKDPDGTVYIFLDSDQVAAGSETGQRATDDNTTTSQDALTSSLQDQIEYLRRELDIRNEELRRKDHLLAATLERIPELETSPEVSENAVASEGGTEPKGSSDTPSEGPTEGSTPSEEPARRRSWLYRFFFGPS